MRSLLIVLLGLLNFNLHAANPGDKALGMMLGNPSGINGKYWLEDNHAVDAGLGISPGQKSAISLHADYLLHKEAAFYFNDTYALDFYYGAGGRMEFGDDIELGLRVPVGVVHNLSDQPADIFVELAPILDFISRFGLELHVLAGGRYYF